MATQVASLFGVLRMDDSQFRSSAKNARDEMTGLGDQMTKTGRNISDVGGSLLSFAAPAAAALGVAVKAATDFDESVTNTGAVLGLNRTKIEALKNQLRDIGGATRAGPQAVADSFYDIVGGVADASTHMDILNAAIHTSQAGNAGLAGTTKALISVMNSYKFKAKDAAMVSNVLTQTVGKGVGTMDEFAAAFPQVTGLAATLGIGFDDLGGMMAYLTTQGNSASQSATQLGQMMVALMNPNEAMKEGLKELGFNSGEAAIQALGLTGAYEALANTHKANTDGMAKMAGSVEALRGITSLTNDDVGMFMTTFTTGLDGATAAAEQIQMGSAAAQFDLLKSSVSDLGITAGTALTPVLVDIAKDVTPIVNGIADWIGKNPDLVKGIGEAVLVVTGLGLALKLIGGLVGVGGSVATAITTFSATTIGGLLISIGLVAAAVGALILAFKQLEIFQGQMTENRTNLAAGMSPWIKAGGTKDQAETQGFKSAQSQFGDLGARLWWGLGGGQGEVDKAYDFAAGTDVATRQGQADAYGNSNSLTAKFAQRWHDVNSKGFPSGDYEGVHPAGAYVVGTGAQPQLFMPTQDMYGVPNIDKAMGGGQGGGMQFSGDIYVTASNPEEFGDKVMKKYKGRGN